MRLAGPFHPGEPSRGRPSRDPPPFHFSLERRLLCSILCLMYTNRALACKIDRETAGKGVLPAGRAAARPSAPTARARVALHHAREEGETRSLAPSFGVQTVSFGPTSHRPGNFLLGAFSSFFPPCPRTGRLPFSFPSHLQGPAPAPLRGPTARLHPASLCAHLRPNRHGCPSRSAMD